MSWWTWLSRKEVTLEQRYFDRGFVVGAVVATIACLMCVLIYAVIT